jgi:acyl carrier protein
MVPVDLVTLERMPLNASGKVDRARLPRPGAATRGARAAYVAPHGPIEEAIAEIWQEVLGVERVGAEDDFLALGGHSLLSIQIATRIEEAFGIRIPLKTLFSKQTMASLAVEIEDRLLASVNEADLAKVDAGTEGGSALAAAGERRST